MTDLIKFLRTSTSSAYNKVAADRIEELVKERDDYAHKLMEANNTYTEMHVEIERLSDKLTKAVKALRKIADYTHIGEFGQAVTQHAEARIARAMLRELEGKK